MARTDGDRRRTWTISFAEAERRAIAEKAKIKATGHGFRSSFKDWAHHEGVGEILSEFALALRGYVGGLTDLVGRDNIVRRKESHS